MALKIFKNDIEPQCAYCEYAQITSDKSAAVCRKIGGIMQLHSKCKKYKYDPLKREPKSISFSGDFSREDFEI